jgi:hypothetical protein
MTRSQAKKASKKKSSPAAEEKRRESAEKADKNKREVNHAHRGSASNWEEEAQTQEKNKSEHPKKNDYKQTA